jgi:hypothetical protein
MSKNPGSSGSSAASPTDTVTVLVAASHSALLQSGNLHYFGLYAEYMRVKYELEAKKYVFLHVLETTHHRPSICLELLSHATLHAPMNYDVTSVQGSDFDIPPMSNSKPGKPVLVIESTARALAAAKEKRGGKSKGKMKVPKPMKPSLTSRTAR